MIRESADLETPIGVDVSVFRVNRLFTAELTATFSWPQWRSVLGATKWSVPAPNCWTRHECTRRYADVERALEEAASDRAASDHSCFFEMEEDDRLQGDLEQLAVVLNHCIDPDDPCWFIAITFITGAPLTPQGRHYNFASPDAKKRRPMF
jgi:hypothetical protein